MPDGNYSLTFRIYSDSTGGSAKWSEAQLVMVSKGLFNVILGSVIPIPDSIFNYSNTWLGIQVSTDPEMTPRQRLSSLGYAYRGAKADTSSYSLNSDKLDGFHASDFIGTGTDFGRSGVATDLYEGTSTLTSKYVNEGQTSSVTSSMITDSTITDADISASANISASKINNGSGSGLDADLLDGQHASAFLSTSSDYGRSGVATDLYEGANTLSSKYVNTEGPDSVYITSGRTAFLGKASGSNSSWPMVGIEGYADNTSTASAIGGYFSTSASGTGDHYGVRGEAYGASSSISYGSRGYAENTSTGGAIGGAFEAGSSGTSYHYGVRAEGYGASSYATYGSSGYADNTSTGMTYGGYFLTGSSGTGIRYGVRGEGHSSSAASYGVFGYAENTSTAGATGGSFVADSSGTGPHYGVAAGSYGASSSSTYGSYGYAYNTSTGSAYGGYFTAWAVGTGTKYGVYTSAPTAQGYAGYFSGDVRITDSLVVLGGKSAAVKVDNGEYRLLYSQESPENWFEDFGKGKLTNGRTTIQIDPLFAQTVNTKVEYHVFLTPQDEPLTLAVANKTPTSFDVVASAGANISFSYRIVAKRKGLENIRLAKMKGPTPEEVALEQEKHQAEMEKERARMEEERIEREKEQEKIKE